jgi:hypothetical protein
VAGVTDQDIQALSREIANLADAIRHDRNITVNVDGGWATTVQRNSGLIQVPSGNRVGR